MIKCNMLFRIYIVIISAFIYVRKSSNLWSSCFAKFMLESKFFKSFDLGSLPSPKSFILWGLGLGWELALPTPTYV